MIHLAHWKTEMLTKRAIYIAMLIFVAVLLGSVGVGFLVQQNPLIKAFDAWGYEAINGLPRWGFLLWLIKPFNYNWLPTVMPSYFYPMFGLFFGYMFIFKRSVFWWSLVAVVLGTFITGWITALDWRFVFRERPFDLLPSTVDAMGRSAWHSWSSYPSGHTRETTLYLTIFTSFIPKLKWPAIGFIGFIMFSRIYLGAHFPTDVIAGAVIGWLAAKVTLLSLAEIQLLVENLRGKRTKGDRHGEKIIQRRKDRAQD